MTTATKDWFRVDKEGLAKLMERRGKQFVLYELLSNAWDTKCGNVTVTLRPVPGQPYADIFIWDDHPDGWKNLEHAYTLFAESEKKGDPQKRGRFNLGEKLVLALCQEARIETTTGTVVFGKEGRRHYKSGTQEGSSFEARIRMTREEYEQVEKAVRQVIPPSGVETRFNGQLVGRCPIFRHVACTLPTEMSDGEGILRRTTRQTTVDLHRIQPGETAWLYEMGLPVVELAGNDKFHCNIQQKVPLNSDRDNVTPAYLRELRTAVLNGTYDDLEAGEAADAWVRDATNEDASLEAVSKIMDLRFTDKRVIADMNDPEGTKLAMSKDYEVIQPGALSGNEWAVVKRYGLALPAGKVTPSPKPFSPDGAPLILIPRSEWTNGMVRFARYVMDLAPHLVRRDVEVRFTAERTWQFRAAYGGGVLTVSVAKLGRTWFDEGPNSDTDELLIHEFAHEEGGGDHLSCQYHEALCVIGSRFVALALADTKVFSERRK